VLQKINRAAAVPTTDTHSCLGLEPRPTWTIKGNCDGLSSSDGLKEGFKSLLTPTARGAANELKASLFEKTGGELTVFAQAGKKGCGTVAVGQGTQQNGVMSHREHRNFTLCELTIDRFKPMN
jgi:hypothetical protein